jgi:hypothetical protein
VTLEFGKWLNSAKGTQAVQILVNSVNDAVENLAPHVTVLAIAFGELIGRVGDPVITGLSSLMARAADATARWVDTITAADVYTAFDKLRRAASGFTDKLVAARDVVAWLAAHEGAIRNVSDALAGIGIVVGVATGSWVAVVAGAVTIILNHFQAVGDGAEWMWDRVSAVFNTIAEDPWVQKIVAGLKEVSDMIRDDFGGAMDLISDAWDRLAPIVEDTWDRVGPVIAEMFNDPTTQEGMRIWADALLAGALALIALAAAIGVAAAAFGALTVAMEGWVTGTIAEKTSTAFQTVTDAVSDFGDSAKETFTDIRDDAQEKFDELVAYFQDIPDRLNEAWNEMLETAREKWDTFMEYLSELPERVGFFSGVVVGLFIKMAIGILLAIASLPADVILVFIDLKDRAVKKMGELKTDVEREAGKIPQRVYDALSNLKDKVKQRFIDAKDSSKKTAKQMGDDVVKDVQSLPGRIGRALQQLPDRVGAQFEKTRDKALKKLQRMNDGIIAEIKRLPGRAVAAFFGLSGLLAPAGRDLMQGFLDGIRSQIPSLDSLLGSITARIPSKKGPRERDLHLLEPSGRLIMAGLARGISDGRGDLDRRLGEVTTAIGTIGDTMARAAAHTGGGGTTYNLGAGAVTLDPSGVRDVQDLLDMIGGVRTTARQYGATPTTRSA